MQKVENGSVIHHNLGLLYQVLWPTELEADEGGIKRLPADLELSYFYKWGNKGEEAWVRFCHAGKQFTYWLNGFWTKTLLGAQKQRYIDDTKILPELRRASCEWPNSFLERTGDHPLDTVTQEELRNIDTLVARLRLKVSHNLEEITRKSNAFIGTVGPRDHDLYMVFNIAGEEKNTFALRYDKVYPLLPEGGVTLGQGPRLELDVDPAHPEAVKAFLRVRTLERLINKDIAHYRSAGRFGAKATELFNKEVTTILYSGSHFSKRLYPCETEACRPLLEKVANDILDILHRYRDKVKGPDGQIVSIGLDVNSWIVWGYPLDGSRPFRVEEPELNFQESILESYLESFTNILMGYLMDLQVNEVIRPYSYTEQADLNDGIEIGSIRRA